MTKCSIILLAFWSIVVSSIIRLRVTVAPSGTDYWLICLVTRACLFFMRLYMFYCCCWVVVVVVVVGLLLLLLLLLLLSSRCGDRHCGTRTEIYNNCYNTSDRFNRVPPFCRKDLIRSVIVIGHLRAHPIVYSSVIELSIGQIHAHARR